MTDADAGRRHLALVTGGTDGIGKAIALALARLGIGVIVVGRDAVKGAAVVRELRASSNNDDVKFVRAHLGLMRGVDALAAEVSRCCPRLDYLVLCAGIVRGRYMLTPEGIESNFAVDYLGRFALTQRLLPCLMAGGGAGLAARILVIGGAAQHGRIHYDDVNLSGRFNILRVVAQFCAANDIFVIEQSRRLAEAGLQRRVTISTLKVGAVRTNIRREFPFWMKVAVPLLIDPFLTVAPDTVAASALSLLLASDLEGVSGALFTHIKRLKPTRAPPGMQSPEEGGRLWQLSEEMVARALDVGLRPPPFTAPRTSAAA